MTLVHIYKNRVHFNGFLNKFYILHKPFLLSSIFERNKIIKKKNAKVNTIYPEYYFKVIHMVFLS